MSPQSDELEYAVIETSPELAGLPFSVQQAIGNISQASPDPDRVLEYLSEFRSRHDDLVGQLSGENAQRLQWLLTIFGYSHFLSEELLQHPEWILEVSDLYRMLSVSEYRDRLMTLLARRNTSSITAESVRASALDLALFRRQEMLRIVLRDVLNLATLSEIAEELSNVADAILHMALASVIAEEGRRFGLPSCPAGAGGVSPCGFSVIALGKLGGRELNYSSDIDLMFLYTGNGDTTGPDVVSNKEFAKRVANRFTALLSTYTTDGMCYRVDLRLRPEGSLGEVCISLDGARDYYKKRARDWELQMLVKARVVAGDYGTGYALLEFVEPLIYSTTLDFKAIETMSATRERISEKLANKRLRPGQYDVKLTRGGIRDIEFLVQCLQRLHGGREPWVRHGGTMLALSRLLDKDLLSVTEYSRLVTAYQFLRNVEHRLQFEDDRQTHTLPASLFELERIAKRMPALRPSAPGVALSAQLFQDLKEHLENVQAIYDRIVHAQRPLSISPRPLDAPAATSVAVLPSSEESLRGISNSVLDSLEQRAPTLAGRLRQRPLRRAQPAFEHFLGYLLGDPSKLDLLNSNHLLTDYVMQLFETSPFLSEQLMRQPELLEQIRRVSDHPRHKWSFEGLAAPLNDIAALRRFYRSEMIRIQAASICLPEPVFETLDGTSALVEFVIARAYRITLEQAIQHGQRHATALKPFIEPRDEMMVVALGRLGMREFDLASDADLLFIIPDSELERHRFWTRAAEHLIEILTAYTGDGTILSIDTRLRPNGREGPLVQTESSYREYFTTKGEAWEGIAYMKARAVAGDVDRGLEFLNKLQRVDWRRYGQGGRSKQDLRQMRLRLEREQGGASPLKAGRGGYYDADFILMYLRLRGAGLFFKSLNTPERIDIVEEMGHLDRVDAEFLMHATTFYRALDHAIRLVTGHAEGKLPSSRVELEMVCELLNSWTPESRCFKDIEAELASLTDRTRGVFERIFS